ncbi:MAG: hypothetical protein KJ042_13790 [Deltaproteobacteria bacterium]|nr:hypothetical protein [Deltaproteobacteria bacterium]
MDKRIRILMALAPSADGTHRAVARALRDAGAEIIHLGESQTPEGIAAAVLQEDADALVVWPDSAWDADGIDTLRAVLDVLDLGDVPLFVAASANHFATTGRVTWIDARRDAKGIAADIFGRLGVSR